jgi:protein involved in polysaccharide export with SLBB domain
MSTIPTTHDEVRGFWNAARRRGACALVLLVAVAQGCSNGPNSSYEEIGDRVNTRGFGHKYAQPEGQEELVFGPGDNVDVQIANNPELATRQPVSIEGTIQAPFVGPVKVAGLTASQVRDKLTVLIAPYVRDPSIQVIAIGGFNSKNIYIYTTGTYGELLGRRFPLQGDLTLLDLITQMGGFRNPADDDNHVKVIRGDPRHPKVLNINVRDMIVNGYTAGNIQMMSDDIVWIPSTFWARVSQWINYFTYPVQTLYRATREGASMYYFIDDGGRSRGRYGDGYGGSF